MIIRARDGFRGTFWDLRTNQVIRMVKWANTITGEFEAFVPGPNNRPKTDAQGRPYLYRGQTELLFEPREKVEPKTISRPDPIPPEIEHLKQQKYLLRRERLDRKATARRKVVRRLHMPLFSNMCEERNCHRVATYMVADEVVLKPQEHEGRLYERAALVDLHFYCAWHFIPPRELDAKGETVKVLDEIRTRPE